MKFLYWKVECSWRFNSSLFKKIFEFFWGIFNNTKKYIISAKAHKALQYVGLLLVQSINTRSKDLPRLERPEAMPALYQQKPWSDLR